MNVALTILQQLGGNRFIAMTGASHFMEGSVSLSFRIPKSRDGINRVQVVLRPDDTYDLNFWRVRGLEAREISVMQGVFAEDLQRLFTATTGLETSL